MDNTFLQERIDAIKLMIVEYQTAQASLASGAIESYTLDTGQTRQTVTKLNIGTLQNLIDSLFNQYATLSARLEGGTVLVRPQW